MITGVLDDASPEGRLGETSAEVASVAGGIRKRSGEPMEGTSMAKAARLPMGLVSDPSGGTDVRSACDTGPVSPTAFPDPPEPLGVGLLLLTGPTEEASGASVPAVIPSQRPKVGAKKRLASRRLSSLPIIQLPSGEWPHDAPQTGDPGRPCYSSVLPGAARAAAVPFCELPPSGSMVSGVPSLSTLSYGSDPGGPPALCHLEASIHLGVASNRALQGALKALHQAVEAETKVGRFLPSPSSPRT